MICENESAMMKIVDEPGGCKEERTQIRQVAVLVLAANVCQLLGAGEQARRG